ncbi:MAG: phosphatidylglycerol lysyltransferase domain-containing protein [Treponema sp.]|nr:phosphatidylglycerol lysyltransferase domain-containing protein [Treponema sp.]
MNLSDFIYLEQNLETSQLYGSDCSVANMFLLQEKYNTFLYIHQNILFRYYFGDENRTGWAFPIPLKNAAQDYLKNALEFIFEQSKQQKLELRFCLCTQEQKNQLDSCLAQNFQRKVEWKTNRDDCDYIYLQKNLAELPGSKYQKKRNHISRFNRIYNNWQFKPYPQKQIQEDILKVSQKWFHEKYGENDHVLQLELQSIKSALEHTDELKIQGGVLYINDEPAAMTLATPISSTVLDVIYEKCIFEYEKDGAYAVINNQFAKQCQNFLYFNREEDMGVEGLRKAKLSYKPEMLLEKFYGKIL